MNSFMIKTRIKTLDFGIVYLESEVFEGCHEYTTKFKVFGVSIKVIKNPRDLFNKFIKVEIPKNINKLLSSDKIEKFEKYLEMRLITHLFLQDKKIKKLKFN